MGDRYPSKPSHRARALAPEATLSTVSAELSDDEYDLVARWREDFLTHMPDAYPFFRDLHANELIDGWRAICWVRLINATETE